MLGRTTVRAIVSLMVQMVKKTACNTGDPCLNPGSGRPPGEGNGYTLQYSCLENSIDRGPWWAIIHGVARVGRDLSTKPQQVSAVVLS